MGFWDWAKPIATGGILSGQSETTKAMGLMSGYGPAAGLLGVGGGGGADQTDIAKEATAQSTSNAQEIYQQALDEAARAGEYKGPSEIRSPFVLPPDQLRSGNYLDTSNTQANAVDVSANQRAYQATLAEAADATARIKSAQTTDVAYVPEANVGQINTNISAPTMGPAAQTGGVSVDRVSVDPMADALRPEQVEAARAIASAPSAAASQFKAGQSQIVADQLAMADRARGSERAGLRREAIIAAGAKGAEANLSAAALSAQEEQAKRVASAAALQGVRAQDVTSSTAAAGIQAQQANLQAQLDTAIAQGNTEAVNALQKQKAELDVQAQTASVQASLGQRSQDVALSQGNQQVRQQSAVLNAEAKNKAATDYAAALDAAATQNAQLQTGVSTTNAGLATSASKDYATSVNEALNNYSQLQTTANLQSATLAQKQGKENADRSLGVDTTNATSNTAVNTTNAANQLAAMTTNASNQLATEQVKQSGTNAALTTGVNATNTQSKNAQTITDANKSQSADDAQKQGALIGGAGAIISKVISDKRAKEDVEPVSDAQLMDFADAVRKATATYRYKDGFADGGAEEHAGQLADEIERSALGKKIVSRRPDGLRQIDRDGLVSMMAAVAALALRKERARTHG